MPNRILKESICTSNDINALTLLEEVLFYRLIVSCDDFGRYEGSAAVIRGRLFPLRDVSTKQIGQALTTLENRGMLMRYECENHPYLCLTKWERHQNRRARNSKYPAPGDGCLAGAGNCTQMQANAPEESRNRGTEESICEESIVCREPGIRLPADGDGDGPDDGLNNKISATLPLNDNSLHQISFEQVAHWQQLYPAVNIDQELLKMRGWLEANPGRRKTKRGIAQFIVNWLAREQDRAGEVWRNKRHSRAGPKRAKTGDDDFSCYGKFAAAYRDSLED